MNESELKEKFKTIIQIDGAKILKEFANTSPDLIIEKNGRRIAVEIKGSRSTTVFGTALGQLLFAKFRYDLDDLWLIIPKAPSIKSLDWLNLLWKHKIVVLFLSQNSFVMLTPKLLRPSINTKSSEIDDMIINLLRKNENGMKPVEIARLIGISTSTVRRHVKGGIDNGVLFGGTLKNKVTIETGKFRLNII